MNKVKSLSIAIFVALLVLFAICYSFFAKTRPSSPKEVNLSETQDVQTPVSSNRVFLTIVYSPEDEVNYEKEIDDSLPVSAFDLLKEALDTKQIAYETKEYNFGVFVSSINGLASGTDHAWIYFVNGESGQISADEYILEPGDMIEWKYITPAGE